MISIKNEVIKGLFLHHGKDYKLYEHGSLAAPGSALKEKTCQITKSKAVSVNAFNNHVSLRMATDLPLSLSLPFSH